MRFLFLILCSTTAVAAPGGFGSAISSAPASAPVSVPAGMPVTAPPPMTAPAPVAPAGGTFGAAVSGAPPPQVVAPPPGIGSRVGEVPGSTMTAPAGSFGSHVTAPPPGIGAHVSAAPGSRFTAPPPGLRPHTAPTFGSHVTEPPAGIGTRVQEAGGVHALEVTPAHLHPVDGTTSGQSRPPDWERRNNIVDYNRYNYVPRYAWTPYYRDWGFYWGVNSWYDIRTVTCEAENTETHQTYRASETRSESWSWSSSLVNNVAAQALDQCAQQSGGRTDQCRLIAKKCWNY